MSGGQAAAGGLLSSRRQAPYRQAAEAGPSGAAPQLAVDSGQPTVPRASSRRLFPKQRDRLPSILLDDPTEVRLEMQPIQRSQSKQNLVPAARAKPKRLSEVVRTAMLVRNWQTGSQSEQHSGDANNSEVFEPRLAAADDSSQDAALPIANGAIANHHPPRAADQDSLAGEGLEHSGIEFIKEIIINLLGSCFLFSVQPNGSPFYYWTSVVCLGVLYNMIGLAIFIFDDIYNEHFWQWFLVNSFFDAVFVFDILVQSRLVITEDGIEVRNLRKLWQNYKRSYRILLDLLSILPLDFFLFWSPSCSMLRTIRLFKSHRIFDFLERLERRTSLPNASKILLMIVTCYVIFHWNACVYFFFSLIQGIEDAEPTDFIFTYKKVFDPVLPACRIDLDDESNGCLFNETDREVRNRSDYVNELISFWRNKSVVMAFSNFSKEYTMSLYWSALTITTCGQQPYPANSAQNMLEVVDTMLGVVVFATILGSVGSVVMYMNRARADYQRVTDGIKFYMKARNLPPTIQERVLNCTTYMYNNHQMIDEKELVGVLPPRLQGMLAINLHMDTLKKVTLFSECNPGFLYELVLRMQQQMFGPYDYLCQVGDRADVMLIVKRGQLLVIDPNNEDNVQYVSVAFSNDNNICLLSEGSTFGEECVLDLRGGEEQKRVRSVRSLGYSDIYILSRDDVSAVLTEYSEVRRTLVLRAMARERADAAETAGTEDAHADRHSTAAMFSQEERLRRLQLEIIDIQSQFEQCYTSFHSNVASMKKRITQCENVFYMQRKGMRRDVSLTTSSGRWYSESDVFS